MVDPATDARRLRFALAAAGAPISVDALAASQLWSPSALWALIEEARAEGLVAPDASGPGRLRWTDPARRDQALAASTPEDLAALLARAPFPALLLEAARAAARERDFARAAPLYQAIGAAPDRSLFPGGEATWVQAVLEAIRHFRSTWSVAPETLDAAFLSAESRGDLAAQAVLLAARGLQWVDSDAARGRGLLARATEAAEAFGDPAVIAEVRTYIAVSLVLGGRLREGIAAFEEMLGDLPADVIAPHVGPQLDLQGELPAASLSILAFAYVGAGEGPRALDLLQRLRTRGEELGNPALEAQGRVLLGLALAMMGDREAARAHAGTGHTYWRARPNAPYLWHAALGLASVEIADGRAAEAHRILSEALPSWRAAGRSFVPASLIFELLEELERAGQPPLDGLDLDGAIARYLEAQQPLHAGVAHRFQARRLLARQGEAVAARAAEHLEEAVRLLREAGARPDLRLALADAAELAESQGQAAAAAHSRAEIAELASSGARPVREGSLDPLRLASAVLDLGRLGALAPRRSGIWGDVAARLCRDFGAERSAIVELREKALSLLAARGGAEWREALLARVRSDPPGAPAFGPALPRKQGELPMGQLVIVPFADEELRRGGFVALENRETPPAVGPGDAAVLRALGRQIGILLANVALWTELAEVRARLQSENKYYREEAPAAPLGGGRIVARSAAMRELLELVRRVAPTTTPVLVTGETGVGKELVSREVHLLSPRRNRPFVAVHVASLSPGLVASALFGHERGAFTGATEQSKGRFELADGGTLFLDEIGELSAEEQVRLLRVLQEGTFERVGGSRPLRSDFRLVAATNRDLAAEVRAGRFREDLYFRLSAFPVRVPPLRERREEIPTLALYFLERTCRKQGVSFDGLVEADVARLQTHDWPGNVRELEHVVERAALLSDPPRLRIPPLDGRGSAAPAAAPTAAETEEWISLEEAERRYIRKVLLHARGRVSGAGGAADVLKLKPSTLQFWIDKLGLRAELQRARGMASRKE